MVGSGKGIYKKIWLIWVLPLLFAVVCNGVTLAEQGPLDNTMAEQAFSSAERDWKSRRWETAVAKYHEIIQTHPGSYAAAKAHMKIGLYLKFHKKWEEALDEFETGIVLAPISREAQDAKTSIACIHAAFGRYDDAIAKLREVLSETSDWDQVKYCSHMIRQLKRRRATEMVSSESPSSCGQYALSTVFRLKGIDAAEEEIADLLSGKTDRPSLEDLKLAAKTKGLETIGVEASLEQLGSIEMPVIALVKPGHYIVCSAVNEQGVTIYDSARGNVPVTYHSLDFLKSVWTGKVLVFAEEESEANYPLLSKKEMKISWGGVCDCCPESELGDENDNTEYDKKEQPAPCNGGKGMPYLSVNMANLNFVLRDTDLSYSGRGPDVEITRYHNGDDNRDGVFGRSWTFSYNVSIMEHPNGDVDVRRGSGKIDNFYYVGDLLEGMSGIWRMEDLAISTTCPETPEFHTLPGELNSFILKIIQSGDILSGVDDDGNTWTGTIAGSNFTLNTSYLEHDDESICAANVSVTLNGTVNGDTLSGTWVELIETINPSEPDCFGLVTCESDGIFDGARGLARGNYVTFEAGVHDILTKHPDGAWSLWLKEDKSTQNFDEGGKLTSIVDRNGNTLTLLYDGERLASVTDAVGRVTSFLYNPNGLVSQIVDPIGRTASFTYDYNGNLMAATDMAGNTTTYTYDEFSYITAIGTPSGTTLVNYLVTEDEGYSLNQLIDPLGNTRTYQTYDPPAHIDSPMVTDALGRATYYSSTPEGWTEWVTDPLGYVTSYGYDEFGNRSGVTDANGATSSFLYDERGNLISATDAMGNTTTYLYDEWDNLIQVTDPLGRISTYEYDINSNLVRAVDALGNQTDYSYDAYGQMVSLTDARGNTTLFFYDGHGNMVSKVDPLGNTTTYEYDGVGRLIRLTDANGYPTEYTYDGIDRLAEILYSDGNTVQYNYGCCALTDKTDENGNSTHYQYDVDNQLVGVIDALGNMTDYEYDPVGNLIEMSDPMGQTTTFAYDDGDHLERIIYPEGATESYTYDGVGNILTKTDGRAIVTTYQYDANNRLISISAPDFSVVHEYDEVGNRIRMTDSAGVTAYSHDGLNRVISALYPSGDELSYGYDDVGNLTSLANGPTVTAYDYDMANRLLATSLDSVNLVNYQYDPAGNLIFRDNANGTYTSYEYDTRNRLTSLSNQGPSGVIAQYDYELDGIGNRTSITAVEPLERTFELGQTSYTYALGNRLMRVGDTTYGYDANGNQTSKTEGGATTNYNYDSQNRLVRIVSGANTTEYTYDGLGNRIAKTVDGEVTTCLVDQILGLPSVVVERNDLGGMLAEYFYDRFGLIAKRDASESTFYYHYDGLGSTIAMTGASGSVNEYIYNEYGQLMLDNETYENSFRYVGQYGVIDDQNGLYHMRSRFYDSSNARLHSRDPLGYATSLNLYTYANNNPINFVDPSGLQAIMLIPILPQGQTVAPYGAQSEGILNDISDFLDDLVRYKNYCNENSSDPRCGEIPDPPDPPEQENILLEEIPLEHAFGDPCDKLIGSRDIKPWKLQLIIRITYYAI